jgi:anti-sigma B factor antagonist
LKKKSRVTVRPTGRSLTASDRDFRGRVQEALDGGAGEIVIDLNGIAKVDSSGIGVLIAAFNTARERAGSLRVEGASPELLTMFRIMRLEKHFAIAGL